MMKKCPECGDVLYDFSRPGDKMFDLHCMSCGWENDKGELTDDQKFVEVMKEIYNLARGVKSQDYGDTWRDSGLVGIYIKLMIKEGRLRELVWKNKKPQVKGESIRDTLMDIAAYAIYGIMCYDEGNMDGDGRRRERLEEMLLNIKEELGND